MRIYGLLGFPIEHSFSPSYFQHKFENEGIVDCKYRLFPLQSLTDLPQLLHQNQDIVGLNVTSPYKAAIFPYLDAQTAEAKAVGAVNAIAVRSVAGKRFLLGHNTDVAGFAKLLSLAIPQLPDSALVLGTGGASRAVRFVLENSGVRVQTVSRSVAVDSLNYNDLTTAIVQRHHLIVNATPLGMWPHVADKPAILYDAITEQHTLIDLIYNPERTAFLGAGEKRGARVFNGLAMLYVQAEASWRFWNSDADN